MNDSPAERTLAGRAAWLASPAIDRRKFAAGLIAAALTAHAKSAAQSPPKRVPVVAYIAPGASATPLTNMFTQSLRDLAYVDGENISILYRFWAGDTKRLPEIVAELVARKVDVMVTADGASARTGKQATTTIPIVFVTFDPVREGLVDNFARPGGNLTGIATGAIQGKRLHFLREIIPRLNRVGVLDEPDHPANSTSVATLEDAARALTITLHIEHARSPEDFKPALDRMVKVRVQAVVNSIAGVAYAHRHALIELAQARRLATAFQPPLFARDGALIGLGADPRDVYPRAAAYVDRILKGAKPGELPIEQPARWDLIINLKTAKALGLTVPQSVLLQADEIIQ